MIKEHEIVSRIYSAKIDARAADDFVREYLPFIKSETAKLLKRVPIANKFSVSREVVIRCLLDMGKINDVNFIYGYKPPQSTLTIYSYIAEQRQWKSRSSRFPLPLFSVLR